MKSRVVVGGVPIVLVGIATATSGAAGTTSPTTRFGIAVTILVAVFIVGCITTGADAGSCSIVILETPSSSDLFVILDNIVLGLG